MWFYCLRHNGGAYSSPAVLASPATAMRPCYCHAPPLLPCAPATAMLPLQLPCAHATAMRCCACDHCRCPCCSCCNYWPPPLPAPLHRSSHTSTSGWTWCHTYSARYTQPTTAAVAVMPPVPPASRCGPPSLGSRQRGRRCSHACRLRVSCCRCCSGCRPRSSPRCRCVCGGGGGGTPHPAAGGQRGQRPAWLIAGQIGLGRLYHILF